MHSKQLTFARFVPGIAWFIIVLILICLPGKELPGKSWLDELYVDKWVHVIMFAGIFIGFAWPYRGLSISPSVKKSYYIRLMLATIIWGLATEFIQKFFISGRSFDLFDWLADSAGAVGAYWGIGHRKW